MVDLRHAVARLRDHNFALVEVTEPLPVLPEAELDFTIDTELSRQNDFSLRTAERPAWTHGHAIETYISALSKTFANAFGIDVCHLRFGQTSRDECRVFHCDNVKVRLFQTLRGPGTEYLLEDNLNRFGLGKGRNELIVRDPSRVRHVSEGTLFLMRGERLGKGSGVVHRSPPIERLGLRRIYLSLDEGFS